MGDAIVTECGVKVGDSLQMLAVMARPGSLCCPHLIKGEGIPLSGALSVFLQKCAFDPRQALARCQHCGRPLVPFPASPFPREVTFCMATVFEPVKGRPSPLPHVLASQSLEGISAPPLLCPGCPAAVPQGTWDRASLPEVQTVPMDGITAQV